MNQLPEDSLRIYDVTLVTLYNLIGLATMLSSPRTSTPQILTPLIWCNSAYRFCTYKRLLSKF